MLTTLGLALGAVVIFVAGMVTCVVLSASNPPYTRLSLPADLDRQEHPCAIEVRRKEAEEASKEETKRKRKERQLKHLKIDLEHAKELIALEEEANRLRASYTQGGGSSPDVEEAIRNIFDDTNRAKRSEAA